MVVTGFIIICLFGRIVAMALELMRGKLFSKLSESFSYCELDKANLNCVVYRRSSRAILVKSLKFPLGPQGYTSRGMEDLLFA